MGGIRVTFPSIIPFTEFLPLPMFKKVHEANRNLTNYAEESLTRYRRLLDSDPTRVQQTLFTKLFKAEKDDNLSWEEMRSEAGSYIVAGTDTTSNTLTYLVWAVCQHPDIKAALLQELRTLPEDYVDADLKQLSYLNQVIEETLRLYPAVSSGLPRVAPPGGAELSGYWLPGGTVVCAQSYTMHRNPAIFPNPEHYIPSRWAQPTKAMKDAMMPFGKGPRSKFLSYAFKPGRLGEG